MTFSFSKYSGAGNTFIFIDTREKLFPLSHIPLLCTQNGVDGCVFLEPGAKKGYKMRIFNRDGSEAEACGNATRCFVKFLEERGCCNGTHLIETAIGQLEAYAKEDSVWVEMPAPKNIRWNISLEAGGKTYFVDAINTGVPHAVIFCKNLENIAVETEGKLLRHHSFFYPHGANVDFVFLGSGNTLYIRTFERGVEGETLACGTGAIASAYAAHKRFHYPSPVTIETRSKEKLKISFFPDGRVGMEGPVQKLSEGEFSINLN